MKTRALGQTGVEVSELCLGAMMFGAIGNRDHDDCLAIIDRALDVGINGKYRKDSEIPADSRVARMRNRPSFSLESDANQRKFVLVEELLKLASDAGVTLIDLALAFVLQHPAVTAAIIGPRTMAQLEDQLGAPDVTLDDDVLDRIDQLVEPATDIDPRYASFQPLAVSDRSHRRRGRNIGNP